MPQSSSKAELFVYRGVHADHPGHAAAMTGVVVPGDVNGRVTAEQHNLRDSSALSPYISWTHRREIAMNFATSKGLGGLLLQIANGGTEAADTWRWEASPDAWLEEEVLLHGVRIGAEVTRL